MSSPKIIFPAALDKRLAMADTHIVSSFSNDLNQIDRLVLEMGGLVEQQLSLIHI